MKMAPQGGVISPLIWLLIADGLIRCLKEANYFIVGYADDFANFSRGKFDNVNLSVKPEKTGMIRFTKKAGLQNRSLNFFGHDLVLSEQLKYLGLLIDKKLNWGPHIDYRVKKSCMTYGQCRRAIGQKWGLSPKSVHWVAPSDCMIPTYLTAHNFSIINPERTVWNNPSNLFSENDLVFYTDGSLREGLAG